MNKGELIKAMAEKAGLLQKDAAAAYDAFVATVTEALQPSVLLPDGPTPMQMSLMAV